MMILKIVAIKENMLNQKDNGNNNKVKYLEINYDIKDDKNNEREL